MPRGIYKRTKPSWRKGKKMPKIYGVNISKGKKGMKFSEEHKQHLRDAKGVGKYNHCWKGIQAHITAKHQWLYNHYGKANRCDNPDCKYPRKGSDGKVMEKPKGYDWANISLKYRRDVGDYIPLCSSCHKKWDLGIISIRIKGKLVKHN